jgi:hypothetical protein
VFASHLHLKLDLLRQEPDLHYYKMQVVEQVRQLEGGKEEIVCVPTWRLVPGECCGSLAFSVAKQQGLPEGVLQLAEKFQAEIQQMGGYHALLDAAQTGFDHDDDDDNSSSSSRTAPVALHMLQQEEVEEEQEHVHPEEPQGARSRPGREMVQGSGSDPLSPDAAAAAEEEEQSVRRASLAHLRSEQLEQELQGLSQSSHNSIAESSRDSPLPATDLTSRASSAPSCKDEAAKLRERVDWIEQRLAQLAASTCQAADPGTAAPAVHHLPNAALIAPPNHCHVGAIYVLLFPSGYWYVGETEVSCKECGLWCQQGCLHNRYL